MRTACLFTLLLSFLAWAEIAAAGCEQMLALSKVISRSATAADKFDEQAREFCSEYSKSGSKASTRSLGVSYAGVGVSGGNSSASAEAIAQRTCDRSNASAVRQDAYQTYVETIAPGAYPAYEACLRAEKTGISMTLVTATERSMSVSVTNGSSNRSQVFTYGAEDNIACEWSTGRRKSITLGSDESSLLACTRPNSANASSVAVFVNTLSSVALGFPWQAYKDGEPVSRLAELQRRLHGAEAALRSISGGVVAFNADQCPTGWSEYAPAQGRFVRGVDRTQRRIDPEGERSPGSVQAQAVGPHEHTLEFEALRAASSHDHAKRYGSQGLGGYLNQFKKIGGEGVGPETRPVNVALLYCVRD